MLRYLRCASHFVNKHWWRFHRNWPFNHQLCILRLRWSSLLRRTRRRAERKLRNSQEFFKLFKDFVFSVALFHDCSVLRCYYCMPCHRSLWRHARQQAIHQLLVTICGGWPFLAGLQFAAGMSVLVYGVRQFIAELPLHLSASQEAHSRCVLQWPPCNLPVHQTLSWLHRFLPRWPCLWHMVAIPLLTIMIPAAGIFFSGTAAFVVYAYGGWHWRSSWLLPGWYLPDRWSSDSLSCICSAGNCRAPF